MFARVDGSPHVRPPLDPHFMPLVLVQQQFRTAVAASGCGRPLVLAVERTAEAVSHMELLIFPPGTAEAAQNLPLVERLVKSLLWARGGHTLYVGGAPELATALRAIYAPGGARAFDAEIMARIYERPFRVVACAVEDVPAEREPRRTIGGQLAGCRIGFDAGASDRKVAAVIDGEAVYSEEVVWDPRPQTDPQYHFDEIMTALRTAAAHLPRVDAIGVSSAGVYVDNRVRTASLFRGVPAELFHPHVTELFLRIQEAWNGVPLEVVNDGDVTALAGALSLETTAVIGVALGSSEAGGYVTPDGCLTSWLNELAFVPIDVQPDAPLDEWSGDRGCGVQYLSQQAVGRLIPAAGLPVDPALGLPERLKAVQALAVAGDARVWPLYETIGVYLGYAMAHYAEFYDIRHALILGRVTSGEGGATILAAAERVLQEEFPDLAQQLTLHLPNEQNRRVGQAIAAASLPQVAVRV
jgi:predicted NBD/HSP70 family sugar kinase